LTMAQESAILRASCPRQTDPNKLMRQTFCDGLRIYQARFARHRLDLNDADAIPAARFDLVIATDVIEHRENPRQVARKWFQILKPEGTLILSLLVRGHYVAFLDSCCPAHTTALLRKDLMRILTEAGFPTYAFIY
jgi:SAM-dependent methyltransferase